MRKIAVFAILGLFVAAFAFAQSEETTTTTTTTQQPSSTTEKTVVSKNGEVIATIEKVDVPTKTIVVKRDENGVSKTYTYTYNEKTVFGSKDNMLKVDELKAGDTIVLQSSPDNVVKTIRIETTTETPPDQPQQ
jgi:hypothetical protein